ncbi:cytochrome c biogenesis protein CcsA [Acidipila sp. EB88]|uniref:cytochrome c biogenesis protein CcsA n=1 Tax=Acidipila sp. EB88 TaxID=2305226 RepID=UPI001F3C79D9|nr:cytochrome c biogenesis protein CcsA [Acidipila sp. EB88]
MKLLRTLWLCATLLILANGLRVALFVVPADAAQGDLSRIFYYHLPAWIGTSVFFALNLAASISYLVLRNRKPAWALHADAVAVAAAELGVVFCTVGLVTGSLWGRAAWGIWWTWDERLTSTLILWLIYIAYLLLRSFAEGASMRTLAAVMAIFGYLDVPLVYMSTRWWRTQHPGPVFFGGPGTGMDASMLPALRWNITGWLMWGLFVAALRYQSMRRAQRSHDQRTEALLAPRAPRHVATVLEGDRA